MIDRAAAGCVAALVAAAALAAPPAAISAPPPIERIATFDPPSRSVEIAAWHAPSRTLLWIDSISRELGAVEVRSLDPFETAPGGPRIVPLGGEPTSVAAHPSRPLALVTLLGDSLAAPGRVVFIDIRPQRFGERLLEIEVGIHPDSIAISGDGRVAVVACEAEEDPATPGSIAILDLAAAEAGDRGAMLFVEGLDEAGLGPIGSIEPEFVAIDAGSRFAAVSLQENDAVAIVDLRSSPPRLAAVIRLPEGSDPDGVALLDGHPSPTGGAAAGVLLAVAEEGRRLADGRLGGQSASFHWIDPRDLAAPQFVGRVDLRGDGSARSDPEGIALLRRGNRTFAAVGLEQRNAAALVEIDPREGPRLLGEAPTGARPEGTIAISADRQTVVITADEGEPGTLSILRVRPDATPPPSLDGASAAAAAMAIPQAAQLRAWHDLVAAEPQVAGTAGDHRSIASLLAAFESIGLAGEAWWFQPLLSHPIEASLAIVDADGALELPLRERPIESDPDTSHPQLGFGWNAYSGSGEVEAEVVYANRGLAADYERLREWGVEVQGRIVLARYGGAYRGHKALHAEANGAAGLILYTDPADSGHRRGAVWPQGGWANDSQIERGSVLMQAQPGDPLTPFEPALAGARRLDPEKAGLLEIPVQPIGYAAAGEILRRMRGRQVAELPGGEAWPGGVETDYRVEGGPGLRLRLKVEQERRLADTANIFGAIEGVVEPRRLVILGCHHDAWGFGAGDPHAGTIVLLEVARAFGELAAQGVQPRRTLLFAAWGAEEFGIIGSSEWIEANRDRLAADGVAYLNLDMAAMGPRFSINASPSLRSAARRAAAAVPAAGDPEGRSVLALAEAGGGAFRPGSPGGGSDHVGFLGHLAMPVATLHGGGSEGVSYHSNYDTLAWYRAVVGEGYDSALMLAAYAANLAARLAFEPILPLRCEEPAAEAAAALRRLAVPPALPEIAAGVEALATRLDAAARRGAAIDARLDALSRQAASDGAAAVGEGRIAAIDAALLSLDRAWWAERGLFGRPWFRNLLTAPDRGSGYGATSLPILAEPLADGDAAEAARGLALLKEAVGRFEAALAAIAAAAGEP